MEKEKRKDTEPIQNSKSETKQLKNSNDQDNKQVNDTLDKGHKKIDVGSYLATIKHVVMDFANKIKEKSVNTTKKLLNTVSNKKENSELLKNFKQKSKETLDKATTAIKEKKENSEALAKFKQSGKDTIKKVSDTVVQKKAEKEELKPEKVILAPGQVRRYKLFFVSDMEEEAAYLHEMSIKGLHFVKKSGIQYVFDTGEEVNYYYHLGYYEKDKRDGNRYDEIYEEAGWKNIYHVKGEFDGVWNYFRIEIEDNEKAPDIFSDRRSRIALYKRLLSSWRLLLAVIAVCLLCMGGFLFVLNNKTGRIEPIFLIVCIIISIIMIIIFAIYTRIYMKIKQKLEALKE